MSKLRRLLGYFTSRRVLFRIGISCCLGLLVANVSRNLGDRLPNIHEAVSNQFAIYAGEPITYHGHPKLDRPLTNRIMFPTLLVTLAKIELFSRSEWFMLLRIATASLALMVFAWAVSGEREVSWRVEAAGLGVLSFMLIASFTEAWELPSDFPDVAFMSFYLWAALRGRRWPLLFVALIAALNRESAAFAGVIWAAIRGMSDEWRIDWREVAFGAATSVLVYATVLSLRYIMVGPIGVASDTQTLVAFAGLVFRIGEFLAAPSPIGWPTMLAIAIGMPGAWIAANHRELRPVDLRLLLTSAGMFVLSLAFANINEIRPFLPSLVIVAFVAVGCEARRWERLAALR